MESSGWRLGLWWPVGQPPPGFHSTRACFLDPLWPQRIVVFAITYDSTPGACVLAPESRRTPVTIGGFGMRIKNVHPWWRVLRFANPPLTAAETCSVAITKDSNPRSLPSCPRIPPLLPSLASERGSKMCILGRPTFCPPVSRRPTPYGRKDLLLRPLHGIMAHGLQLGTLLF